MQPSAEQFVVGETKGIVCPGFEHDITTPRESLRDEIIEYPQLDRLFRSVHLCIFHSSFGFYKCGGTVAEEWGFLFLDAENGTWMVTRFDLL